MPGEKIKDCFLTNNPLENAQTIGIVREIFNNDRRGKC